MGDLETAAFGDKETPVQTLIKALKAADDAVIAIAIICNDEGEATAFWSDGGHAQKMLMLDCLRDWILELDE